jgi:hypothetical protein
MTLFNVRLGWWLGNPAEISVNTWFEKLRNWIWQFPIHRKRRSALFSGVTYHLVSPRLSLRPLFDEAFGRTTDSNEYVYLSDGGHFDNLGLYEMVRRRCNIIVVSDASCDPKYSFESLANAIRKVRIDLGIPIELITKLRFNRESSNEKDPLRYCAIGRIHYGEVDTGAESGTVIYIKPALTGEESADILNYSRTSKAFPHESTADQWFSEAQFESYRELGQWCVRQICESGSEQPPTDLGQFVAAAIKYCGVASINTPKLRTVTATPQKSLVEFLEPRIQGVEEKTGVYQLYDGNEVIYIGHGTNVRERLWSHKHGIEGALTGASTGFSYEITNRAKDREDELTEVFKATHNGELPRAMR